MIPKRCQRAVTAVAVTDRISAACKMMAIQSKTFVCLTQHTHMIFIGFGVTWQSPTRLHTADQFIESRHVRVAHVWTGAGAACQRLLQMLRHERRAVALLWRRQLSHLRAGAQLHSLHLSLHLLQRAHGSTGRCGQKGSRLNRPRTQLPVSFHKHCSRWFF